MEEYNKLFNEYSKLGLDDKRNIYSEEIIKISLLLKEHLKLFNLDLINEPYNYKKDIDKRMTESELLNRNYEDIYILKMELLLLLNKINNSDRGNL